MNEELILGTEAKALVTINPIGGYTAYDFDFDIELYTNPSKKVVVPKGFCFPIEGDETKSQFYVPFNSDDLGVGEVTLVVVAHIPDDFFPDGLRTERVRIESLATIIP